jgi:hypothetical protein
MSLDSRQTCPFRVSSGGMNDHSGRTRIYNQNCCVGFERCTSSRQYQCVAARQWRFLSSPISYSFLKALGCLDGSGHESSVPFRFFDIREDQAVAVVGSNGGIGILFLEDIEPYLLSYDYNDLVYESTEPLVDELFPNVRSTSRRKSHPQTIISCQ